MKNKLEIELFRVSPDSKYLEVIFNMPGAYLGFYMSSFKLEVRDGNGNHYSPFDLTEAVGFSPDNHTSHWVIRIPLEDLGVNYPAMYIATFKASLQTENCNKEIIDTAICSDVSSVYQCLLEDIVDSCDNCSKGSSVSDETIRNYLILYGHQSAMYRRDLDVAERYFKILSKCFKSCSGGCNTNCCGQHTHNVKSDCGCKK